MAILTLGHSTHTPEAFLNLMDAAELDGIIDVRSHPTSKWEWWWKDHTKDWLEQAGKTYRWMPELGGWDKRHANLTEWAAPRGVDLEPYIKGHFPKQRIGASKLADQLEFGGNPAWVSGWTSQGLHDYAWFTATDEFQTGIDTLITEYDDEVAPRVALVCAEAPWWKCHRASISDVLSVRGTATYHVMPSGRNARMTWHDVTNRLGRYPDEVRDRWFDWIDRG